MAVTYGFYNSLNGDRKYDAIQMSQIFDGIIEDGVYMNIGQTLSVSAGDGMSVIVGTGRAWFNHTWTLNDAPLPLDVEVPELVANRIDAVVLDIQADLLHRENKIMVLKGPPTTDGNPKKPTLILDDEENHWQYALAFIKVPAGSTEVSQTNITNAVGLEDTPFVKGVLEAMSIDSLVAQWESQFDDWFSELEEDLEGNPVTNLQVQINRINGLRFVTLSKDRWTTTAPYTQTIPILGFRDKDTPFIQCVNDPKTLQEKSLIQKQWNFVDDILVTTDSLVATCKFVRPTIDFTIAIKGR